MDKAKNFINGTLFNQQWHLMLLQYGLNILFAIIIFFIGWWVAVILRNTLDYILKKNKIDKTVRGFVCRIFYVMLMVLVLIAMLSRLGVQTASIIAILASAGLAIGLSLKNFLGNFASGILLISSRLFKEGDVVEIDGVQGTVEDVQIFFTTVVTFDNQVMTLPNSAVVSNKMVLYSRKETRRISIVVGIDYDNDIDVARKVLMEVMHNDMRVLKDPAPIVYVTALGDSSVNLTARCWVSRPDYWATFCDLTENFKKKCDANDINIPYPQRDVHIRSLPKDAEAAIRVKAKVDD